MKSTVTYLLLLILIAYCATIEYCLICRFSQIKSTYQANIFITSKINRRFYFAVTGNNFRYHIIILSRK